MSPRACPACGGVDARVERSVRDADGRDARYDLARCASCGAGYVDPVPVDDSAYYGDGFYASLPSGSSLFQRAFLAMRANVVTSHAKVQRGSLLDVGAGAGEFVSTMAKRGFTCAAMEPSSSGRARMESLGVRAVSSLSELVLDLGSFDVITMWQSLEHIADPVPVLKQIKALLAKNAPLVVSVPNAGSLEARVFGDDWFHLDVPRHVLQLNERALRTMLERAGFVVDDVVGFSAEYDVFGIVQSAYDRLGLGSRKLLYHAVKHGVRPKTMRDRVALGLELAALPAVASTATVAALALAQRGRAGTITLVARAR